MSPDYKQQLQALQKTVPDIEQVYQAIQELQGGSKTAYKVIWSRYYYRSLKKAYIFFGGEQNEEIANQAAFALVEHLVSHAFMQYDEDKAKLTPFYNKVAQNFFINYLEREVLTQPGIFYGRDYNITNSDGVLCDTEYPYDGIEPDFVDTLMEVEEVQERINLLKEDLYPAERRVLELLVQGYEFPEIREELDISVDGLKNSVRRIRSLINEE